MDGLQIIDVASAFETANFCRYAAIQAVAVQNHFACGPLHTVLAA